MNKNDILSKVLNKKVQDYSFLVFFFLIFAVFVFFAIRPNLLTAFRLQSELEELRFQDQQYERIILNIVEYQTILEQTRDSFYLLEEAIPQSPEIYAMVNEIRKAASDSGIIIRNLKVSQVVLKDDGTQGNKNGSNDAPKKRTAGTQGEENKSYKVEFDIESNMTETKNLLARTFNQRRLKLIKKMAMSSSQQVATTSAVFRVTLEVEGYYL